MILDSEDKKWIETHDHESELFSHTGLYGRKALIKVQKIVGYPRWNVEHTINKETEQYKNLDLDEAMEVFNEINVDELPKSHDQYTLMLLQCPKCESLDTEETEVSINCEDCMACLCHECGWVIRRPFGHENYVQPD